jgi:hypothetical protein
VVVVVVAVVVVVVGAAALLTIRGCMEEKVEEKAVVAMKEKEDLTDSHGVPESMVEPRLRRRGRGAGSLMWD